MMSMKKGVTTIEYAIIILLIINIILSGVAIAYITSVSTSVSNLSGNVNKLSGNVEEVVNTIGTVSTNLQAVVTQLANITGVVVNLTRPAPPALEVTESVTLKLATFRPGTAWYVYGGALSEIWKGALPAGSSITVLPYAGGVSNNILVANKSVDVATSFSITAKWAYDGTGPFKMPYKNIRILAAGLDIYWLGIAARNDTDIKTIDDIINPEHPYVAGTGPTGSLSEFTFRQVLEAYGLTYSDLKAKGVKIVHAGIKSLKTQLQNRQLDVLVWVITPGHPTWTELFIRPGMWFIGLPDNIRSSLINKYGYADSVIPKGLFSGSNEVKSVSTSTIIIVRDDMPKALAYTLIKAMYDNKAKLVAAHKALERWDASKIKEQATIPVHSGALVFYKEKGFS